MEYLAMGKSVIVTDIEAHREVLNGLPCGIFIKSHNVEEIARAIERAYRRRHEFRKRGRMGREMVIQRFTWDKQAENLTDFLKAL
jgi:glycosyltransferase involved in cell wall biosynthesis